MIEQLDIIVFVEDPGSVNMLLSLPEFLESKSFSWKYIAHGVAKKYVQNLDRQ